MEKNGVFYNYYINYNDPTLLLKSIQPVSDGNVLRSGSFYSDNFSKGDVNTGAGGSGFGLYDNGDAYLNNAYIRGLITASEIHIPYKEIVTSYHVISNGTMWSGCKYSSFLSNIENAPFYVLNDGTLKATLGKIGATTIYSDRLVGGLIKTSDSTTRIELNGAVNELRVYQAGNLVASLGAFDGLDGEMLNINYSTTGSISPMYVRGNVPNSSLAWFHNDGDNRCVVVSSNTSVASGALYVRNGTPSTIGTGIAASFESNSTDPLLPTMYIKNGGSNGTALRLNGSFISDNQYPRADNTYDIGSASVYYKNAYIRSIKTGFLEPYVPDTDNIGAVANRWNVIYAKAIDVSTSGGLTINGVVYQPTSISYTDGGGNPQTKTFLMPV